MAESDPKDFEGLSREVESKKKKLERLDWFHKYNVLRMKIASISIVLAIIAAIIYLIWSK